MALPTQTLQTHALRPIPVEQMRTLLVCRGPIAFETLEVYRRLGWCLPHVVVSSKEWIADVYRAAPWIVDLPAEHVHYVQEYNDVEAILTLAQTHALDAIYPGYGFLAESADFATRVAQAGLRFIGPTPETLRAVGDKDTAIALAKRLDIPTIPGDDSLIAFARQHAQEATAAETVQRTLAMAQRHPGSPVRLKHPAGGGGKGQRVLPADILQGPEAAAAIRDALTKIWSEMGVSSAEADAGKGVLLELNIPRPLHWEVQIFGDGETVVHFAARDCSLQNHGYQKFIEVALHAEAIAYEIQALDASHHAARIASLQRRRATLEHICAHALRLGAAVRLRGAATVEFLVDLQGQPYFLEVNPRIQVEHGVTEGIARVRGQALSLVEWQQRVAAGETLPFQQKDITFTGDAIEIRLNAWHEDLSPVLGGVVQSLRLTPSPAEKPHLRVEAGGLVQRYQPWVVPSYDANFALLIVHGRHRHETLTRMIATLDQALHLEGNAALQTNLQPLIGLLTLMRALPAETAFRTDTSLLWMALTACVVSQNQAVCAQLPAFPRRLAAHDPAQFARLLRATCEAGMAHPSRLLTAYLKRLTAPNARPMAALEVLWFLAQELSVPCHAEEAQQGAALQQAAEALWHAVGGVRARFLALLQGDTTHPSQQAEYAALCAQLVATTPELTRPEAEALLQELLGWLRVEVPALTTLLQTLERTQLHTFLTANDDLSLSRPAYLEDTTTVAHLQRLLSSTLRPALLRHGALLSPMEATIYHQPEPGAPPFVAVGAEVHVGQTLALLEAMKMFSELPSPVDGVLVAILVDSGQGVKTGTPLFEIAVQEATPVAAGHMLQTLLAQPCTNRFDLIGVENTP